MPVDYHLCKELYFSQNKDIKLVFIIMHVSWNLDDWYKNYDKKGGKHQRTLNSITKEDINENKPIKLFQLHHNSIL